MSRYDLVCIGCGPAGETAAVTAGLAGYRTLVVEAAGRPGGAMVNTGTIASKVLRETALVCSAFRRRPVPGMDASPDTNLSLAALTSEDDCIVCGAGSFCPVGSADETLCSPGTYNDQTERATCMRCEPGTYQSAEGATACVTCPAGSHCAEGASAAGE